MRRRSFLRTMTGTVALGSVGVAAAHPKAGGSTGTPPMSETPTGPGPLGSVPVQGATEAVVRDETTVFMATTDGFAVVDVADPADPIITYRTDAVLGDHEDGPMEGIWDVKVDGNRLLVVGPANSGHDSVHGAVVYDVREPDDPRRATVHETDYPVHNAFLADGVAYLTNYDGDGNPLVTVDADSGTELGRWSVLDYDDAWQDVASYPRVLHDVWVHDDLAYLAHWDAGTWILDVSDPAAPEFVSRIRGRSAAELATVEDTGIEATELPGNDHFVTVDESGSLLGVGVESWAADENSDSGPGGLLLYDVSDPTTPEQVSRIDPPPTPEPTRGGVWTTAHNFEFVDGQLYSAWYQGGVKVHDVSDPTNPEELFHWRDAARAKFWTAQLGVPGEFFVASSWDTPGDKEQPGGLFTFPDPEQETPTPTPTATARAPSSVTGDSTTTTATGVGLVGLGALGLRRLMNRR